MLAPRIVGNVTLTEHTDFAELVRKNLAGAGGLGSLRSDNFPLDVILRVHAELAGSPYAQLLERGVAACLTDPDPFVRAQALTFFQVHPCTAADERVDQLLAGDRRLFRGVPDPVHPGTDLEQQLLALLGPRVAAGDPAAVALLTRCQAPGP